MKIAIDGRFWGLENAGLGRYTMNLISELQNIDSKNKYYVLLRKKYFNILKFPSNWRKVLADIPHYTLREQILIPHILSKIKPDLYHALQINFPIIYRGKSIVTFHDLTQISYLKRATTLPGLIYFIKHIALKIVVKNILKNMQKVIVPSKAVGRDLIDIHGVDKTKLKVIYEGVTVQDDIKNISIPEKYIFEEDYFLYVGNAYPHKNIERLIDAIIELNMKQDKKIILVLGGSRDIFKRRIEQYLIKNKYEQYIRTVGYIPDEYMKILYERSVGFVYPSLAEGFGLQGIEAMRAGTLLLASNIPVFKEIYKNNALYFNPYDFSEITRVLIEALEMNKIKRMKIINNAQLFSKRYSWMKMAKRTLRIYKSAF